MKFGRNQKIIIMGSLLILGAGFAAANVLPAEKLAMFLDFAGSFGKWALGFVSGFSATIKAAGLIRNGKKPEG